MQITEEFCMVKEKLIRETTAGTYSGISELEVPFSQFQSVDCSYLRKVWWNSRLRGSNPIIQKDFDRPQLNIVDLCSGCGGFASGVRWACESVGVRPVIQLCVDVFTEAIIVYKNNLKPLRVLNENIANLVTYPKGETYEFGNYLNQINTSNQTLLYLKGKVDLVIAGPPCEGNSNLNNKTRRFDIRNELYVDAVACAIFLEAKVVIIENVASVTRTRQRVVERAVEMLVGAGYHTNKGVKLDASMFGTPQRRKRHFLIAAKVDEFDLTESFDGLKCEFLSTDEAINDLEKVIPTEDFDNPSTLSKENKMRVEYLINNNLWNLPDSERPKCHQNGKHNYRAVYGRIFSDQPSQTITTGFLSPGRGRFTHPSLARGLTPHEGARLQGFPDDFQFKGRKGENVSRQGIAKLIGDAVPPQLGYLMGLAALTLHSYRD